MVISEKASRINAPAEKVWALFSTLDGQKKLSKGFARDITIDGNGVGSIRTLHTEAHLGDSYVKERLEFFDDVDRELEYYITDSGGLVPFADYHGRAKVIPAGDNACVLMLRSTFIPVDMSEEEAKGLSQTNFRLLFENVKAMAAAGTL